MGIKRINFDGNNKESRLAIVDYYNCWEELRHYIGKYLEEKGSGGMAEDGERYCIALGADDLLNMMSDLEEKYTKKW